MQTQTDAVSTQEQDTNSEHAEQHIKPRSKFAVVKFYNSLKGYGFTYCNHFFHVNAYRAYKSSWHGVHLVDAKPDKTPVTGDVILLHTVEEMKKGATATEWSYKHDIPKSLDWFAVVLKVEQEVKEHPIAADNENRVYKQVIEKRAAETLAFIGTEKACKDYIAAHEHPGQPEIRLARSFHGQEGYEGLELNLLQSVTEVPKYDDKHGQTDLRGR
jgi:hypothetical protein